VDNELEVIRQQMEQKRASLTGKLDALEEQVLGTVHEATAAVSNTVRDVTEAVDTVKDNIQETVEAVKDNIHETVETVKETFNISDRIRQHPWIALGGGFAAGFVGAMLIGSSSRPRRSYQPTYRRPETNGTPPEPVQTTGYEPKASEPSSGLTSQLGTAATEVLNTIKGMAVGTLMGVLSEVVGDVVPSSLKSEVNNLFSTLNTHLGGKELYKLDLSTGQSNASDTSKGDQNDHGNQAEMGRTVGSAQGQGQEPVGQSDRRRADAGSGRLRTNDRSPQGANRKEP